MNRILGNLPNSNRQIEPEFIHRLMFDKQIDNIICFSIKIKELDLLEKQPSVRFLSFMN